jgi:hypothetical protein
MTATALSLKRPTYAFGAGAAEAPGAAVEEGIVDSGDMVGADVALEVGGVFAALCTAAAVGFGAPEFALKAFAPAGPHAARSIVKETLRRNQIPTTRKAELF